MIDDLDARIMAIAEERHRSGADRRYIPILMSRAVDHVVHVACEIGDINRFSVRLTGLAASRFSEYPEAWEAGGCSER